MQIPLGIIQSANLGHSSGGGSSITVNTGSASVYSDSTYYYAAYKNTGADTFTVSGGSLTADILTVGGGGSGYNNASGGGGGGGGVVYSTVAMP